MGGHRGLEYVNIGEFGLGKVLLPYQTCVSS